MKPAVLQHLSNQIEQQPGSLFWDFEMPFFKVSEGRQLCRSE